MNRELKFRAKELATGNWVIGSLNPQGNEISLAVFFANILTDRFDIQTLGEYTGLHDKNGTEIYEGDILKTSTGNEQVLWDSKDGLWGFDDRHPLYFADINQREVIGNIYENPELLGNKCKSP